MPARETVPISMVHPGDDHEPLRASDTEAALCCGDERFRSVLENMSEGVMLFDANGNLTYQNPASLRIHGFDALQDGRIAREELPETWEAFDEDARPIAFSEWPVSRVFRGERFQNQVLHVRRVETGQEFFASYNGSPIRDAQGGIAMGFLTIRDITEQVRAQRALEERELRFRELADSMPQVVWTARPDGTVDYYNQRVRELAGAQRNADGSWAWQAVLHPADARRTIDAWTTAVREGTRYDIAHRVRRADGRYHWYLSRGVPVRDAAGRVARWYGTATDIDAQKRAEERLRESDRNKDEFLAVLSHELRNPLTPIRNSVYILERAAPGGEQAKRALHVVGRQVALVARLIDDLLDLTRISRGKIRLSREQVDLREIVRGTAEDFREHLRKGDLSTEVHLPDEPLLASVDRTRIAQVVGNLLHNAAKFTPAGGRVAVELVRAPDGRALIEVRDDGVGIEPDLLQKLFEPFVQADATLARSQSGLGLGLALARGIVELHGGTIAARSAGRGAGAQFRITLPLLEPGTPAPRTAPPPADATASGALRILVIEDNADGAASLKEALELGGNVVETAGTGPEGIDKARSFGPDVVLCDLGLPGMDGYEVARRMRGDPGLRGIRLVALSGHAAPEDVARAREAGFVRHLAKPPDIAALERTVGETCAPRPSPDAPVPR